MLRVSLGWGYTTCQEGQRGPSLFPALQSLTNGSLKDISVPAWLRVSHTHSKFCCLRKAAGACC